MPCCPFYIVPTYRRESFVSSSSSAAKLTVLSFRMAKINALKNLSLSRHRSFADRNQRGLWTKARDTCHGPFSVFLGVSGISGRSIDCWFRVCGGRPRGDVKYIFVYSLTQRWFGMAPSADNQIFEYPIGLDPRLALLTHPNQFVVLRAASYHRAPSYEMGGLNEYISGTMDP